MQLPSAKSEIITSMLDSIIQQIEPLAVSERSADNAADNPAQVVTSLLQLCEIIQNSNDPKALSPGEVTEIGDYSMHLLANTAQILQRLNDMDRLGYPDHVREVVQEYADKYSPAKVIH